MGSMFNNTYFNGFGYFRIKLLYNLSTSLVSIYLFQLFIKDKIFIRIMNFCFLIQRVEYNLSIIWICTKVFIRRTIVNPELIMIIYI